LGEGGTDWGYTDDPGKARPLNTHWMRRFVADMNRVSATGVNCREVDVPGHQPSNSNPEHDVGRAVADCKKADLLAEKVHMDLSRIYWLFKNDPGDHQYVLQTLDRATDALSDARQKFGDAVYALEKLLES
jgi:hypothetical protein